MDDGRVKAAKALLTTAKNDEERERFEKSAAEPDVVLNQLKKHAVVNSQNLTNNIVNAFQRYFSAIIYSAALKRPAMMSSSQSIKIEDVFRFSRHKDLVNHIIDKKVNELAYGGLVDMERYFNERIGVTMFSDQRQRDLMRLFVEVRNINVHNGGIVNELFASRVGVVDGFSYTKGKLFHVDFDLLIALTDNAMKVATNIDSVVAKKFGMRLQRHRQWLDPSRKKQRSSKAV